MPNYYFAYGSNMNASQMKSRVPNAKLVGPAVLRNYLLVFDGHSRNWGGAVANIIKGPPVSRVYGVLYKVSAEDLKELDKYEGVAQGIYERRTVEVDDYDAPFEAVTYVRAKPAERNEVADDYFAQLVHCYHVYGFPMRGLHAATR